MKSAQPNIDREPTISSQLTILFAVAIAVVLPTPALAQDNAAEQAAGPGKSRSVSKKQVGEASIYGEKFFNKKMADGERMDPHDDNAAHKTLPLGTKAKVTNLETGESTTVTIQDRGPFVKGRIIDLPPGKAEEIGLTLEEGVARVRVEPVKLPKTADSSKD